MRTIRALAATLLACACVLSHATETEYRETIRAEVQSAFARGDYAAIEKRYAAALAASERTPSGLYTANEIRQSVVAEPQGESKIPGRNDYWMPVEDKLADWAARFPKSSLVAVVQSWTYVAHGWSWRGTGYANTVSREAMEKLHGYTDKAYEALMAREKVGRRKDPYWYAQMLDVARVQGWNREQFLGLVQEATEAFPQNYDIYFATGRQLQPRWGGSPQAIASLADYAVRQTRKTEGESMYARVYWANLDGVDVELGGPDVDWKRIRAGFDDIVKRYPDRWNLNHYARIACDAHDVPTTRKVLLRIKGDIEQEAWPDRASYVRCVEAAGLKREELR